MNSILALMLLITIAAANHVSEDMNTDLPSLSARLSHPLCTQTKLDQLAGCGCYHRYTTSISPLLLGQCQQQFVPTGADVHSTLLGLKDHCDAYMKDGAVDTHKLNRHFRIARRECVPEMLENSNAVSRVTKSEGVQLKTEVRPIHILICIIIIIIF